MSDRPEIDAPPSSAAGVKAVLHSMRHALPEMGPVRTARTLSKLNQVDGFDCPSCAWPDPDDRRQAEFCENGAKAVAWEATKKRVGPKFFAAHSVADLRGRDDHWLEGQGRLTEPMHLAEGDDHFRPISWDDAFALVAERLRTMQGPDRAVFYTSGRASNEAAFAYQLLARRLGTNNLPDCSNMCHESSGAALTETIGIGKGTVTYDDIAEHADLIVVVGQNPGTNHPRMLTALEDAKLRGARIVSVNPLPEVGLARFKNPQRVRGVAGKGTELSDRHLAVRLNGDLALFAGVNKLLVERDAVDTRFVEAHTDGYDGAAAGWRALEWDDIEQHSGLPRAEIEAFTDDVVASSNVIVCWAMGLTQHRNSVATIREIVNFLLLRGNMGRPGAGAAPIRGHSNVQGDRTMGIYEKPPVWFLDALEQEFGFPVPREHGVDTVDAIRRMRDGEVEVFVALGGNFVAATPDTPVTAAAMERCGLTVNIATKLNRTHLHPGREALLLPCLGRTEKDVTDAGEQFVTVEDSMGMVHASRGPLAPGSDRLRSEVAIVAGIGDALFGEDVGWEAMGRDYGLVRHHIERVVPGFEHFAERVRRPGGFELPNGPRDGLRFDTATGTARITVNPVTSVSAPEGHLVLQTVRSHDQFNTTVYGMDDRYRGVHGTRMVVFVNAADLVRLGFRDGETVDLVSVWDDGERRAEGFRIVSYPTAEGCAAAYFPETNVLVPLDSTAEISNTPTSKSIVIRLERPGD